MTPFQSRYRLRGGCPACNLRCAQHHTAQIRSAFSASSATLSLAGADTGCIMRDAPTNRMRIILTWDDFANYAFPKTDPVEDDHRQGGVAPQTALSYA